MSNDDDARPAARLTVLSGPSGVGKDSVIEVIRARSPQVWLSVSATTRPKRDYEVDGLHYHFVDRCGVRAPRPHPGSCWSGPSSRATCTAPPANPSSRLSRRAFPSLLKIDLQGARQVRAAMPEALLVFLAPPSVEELERRLVGRGTEDPRRFRRRLDHAQEELACEAEFDVTVVNDSVERAADELVGLLGSPIPGPPVARPLPLANSRRH